MSVCVYKLLLRVTVSCYVLVVVGRGFNFFIGFSLCFFEAVCGT